MDILKFHHPFRYPDLSEEEWKDIEYHVNMLVNTLGPLLLKLTPEQKKNIPRLLEKDIIHLEDAVEITKEDPGMSSSNIDIEELEQNLDFLIMLKQVKTCFEKIANVLEEDKEEREEAIINAYSSLFGGHIAPDKNEVPDVSAMYKKLGEYFNQQDQNEKNNPQNS